MVGAVGEMASVKQRKLWNTGEDGLCCSSSAIQTRLGPSLLLEERSKTSIVFVVFLCCRLPPKMGETSKVYIYIYFKNTKKPVYSHSTILCKRIP